jgi:hypothetical protein
MNAQLAGLIADWNVANHHIQGTFEVFKKFRAILHNENKNWLAPHETQGGLEIDKGEFSLTALGRHYNFRLSLLSPIESEDGKYNGRIHINFQTITLSEPIKEIDAFEDESEPIKTSNKQVTFRFSNDGKSDVTSIGNPNISIDDEAFKLIWYFFNRIAN